MKCHRHLRISSRSANSADMARYIEAFGAKTAGWSFPLEQSRDYEVGVGEAACCVVAEDSSLPRSTVHLAQDSPNGLFLTNIIPQLKDKLTVDEYNMLAKTFAMALRKSAKADKMELVVTLSKSEIRLDDMLGGSITKKMFRRFLALHPKSGHPNDIERLDLFTCAVGRFSRKRFDLAAFQYLLIEELKWSPSDAKWCRGRVEIGLEVLKVSHRF